MIRIKRIMKYLTTSLLAGALVAITGAATAEADKEKPKRGDGGFFKKLDTDGDRAISKEEAGDRWDRFAKLDKDEDGKVSAREMMAGRPDGKGPHRKPGALLERADKNGDGLIGKDEVPERAWERLGKLDKDGDDAVSKEELAAGRPDGPGGPGRGGEMLKRADKNGDGLISKDEVPERAWERLGKLDKDGDDAVSREELAAGRPDGAGRPGRGPGGPGAMFERFDENEDGKLAEGEVPGPMWDKLRKADSDADGLVSKEELGKVYERRGGPNRLKKKPEDRKKPEDDAV